MGLWGVIDLLWHPPPSPQQGAVVLLLWPVLGCVMLLQFETPYKNSRLGENQLTIHGPLQDLASSHGFLHG